jgi:basic membrane protein A and related proteins
MRKFIALALVLVMTLIVAACAPAGTTTQATTGTYEMALITDIGNIDDHSFNQSAWEGMKAFAEEKKISYAYYRPSEDSTAARVEQITTAVSKGAKTIVCPGYLFEEAIYNVQDTYPNVMFLLLDGEPHTADYSTYKTSPNVHCILYKEEQAGFLAGYAIVKDGYRKLGFLGGKAVPAVVRYGYGFIQGAEAAGKELGLAANAIEIKYWYSDVFVANDDIKNRMASWYSSGTEVVFACGGGIYQSAVAAAEAAQKKVIGVDKDQSFESQVIITSAMKDLTTSVKLALTSLYANNGKWDATYAGKTAVLGAAEKCVGLPTATTSWRFKTFTVTEYDAVFKKIVDKSITISNDITKQPTVTICKVDYQTT